jgi:hypothetical protein
MTVVGVGTPDVRKSSQLHASAFSDARLERTRHSPRGLGHCVTVPSQQASRLDVCLATCNSEFGYKPTFFVKIVRRDADTLAVGALTRLARPHWEASSSAKAGDGMSPSCVSNCASMRRCVRSRSPRSPPPPGPSASNAHSSQPPCTRFLPPTPIDPTR